MAILRIEHSVTDYGRWKEAFDSDPADRRASGVRSYRVLRGADDPDYVMIDLEFGTVEEARALLGSLRVIWGRVQGSLIAEPSARIAESAEWIDY